MFILKHSEVNPESAGLPPGASTNGQNNLELTPNHVVVKQTESEVNPESAGLPPGASTQTYQPSEQQQSEPIEWFDQSICTCSV